MPTDSTKTGRNELVNKVRIVLGLSTKKETEHIIDTVISSIEEILLDHLIHDKFSLKLKSFGKFTVHHKRGIIRRIPFTGKVKLSDDKRKIKFTPLGKLRKQEKISQENKKSQY